MVKPLLRILQIEPVEPKGHYHNVPMVGVVNLLAHLCEVFLVYGREDVRLVEVDVFPSTNKPIKRLKKQNIPWVVLGLLIQTISEFLVLLILKHIPWSEVLPVRPLRHKDVV